MRVLLLVHRTPYPPDKGDKIRSFRLLEALASRHDVDLVTHADDPADLRHLPELERRCRSVRVFPLRAFVGRIRSLRALINGEPMSVAHFRDPAAEAAVRELVRTDPPDVVVVFSAQGARLLPDDLRVPLVVDLVDVDSEKWRAFGSGREHANFWLRPVYRIEAARLRGFERRLAERARRIILVTAREAAIFRERVTPADVAVIPNGVEIPADDAAPRERSVMTFVGAMDYAANVEAARIGAEQVLPLVRRRVPDARFRIVGRSPSATVRRLARLPGVEVTGAVPDVRPLVRASTLSLVPLRVARGIQNKVLEALANATPVVATPDVAASLGGTAGEHLLVGVTAEELAAAAIRLLEDPTEARRLGDAGRAFVAREFRWERSAELYLQVVEEAARAAATVGEPSS